MRKAVRAIAYGGVMAAAVAAALPSHARVTAQDRVGTPMQVVVPAGYVAAVPGSTVATENVYVTKDGIVREQIAAASPSSTAGSGDASVAAVPQVMTDRRVETDRAFIISNRGRSFINVNWGDVVSFQVRDPNSGNQHLVKWRVDGMDNVVSFADVDPQAPWARNVRVFVNQSTNPMHSSDLPLNRL